MQPEAEPVRIASDVSITMAFACENFSTDPMQRQTYHNVIDQLNALAFPVQTQQLYVVFAFQRTIPGFLVQCVVDILPPAGEPIRAQPVQDLAFRPDQMLQRNIVAFFGMTWPTPGEYTVRFTSRGNVVASFIIRLVQVQPPAQQMP